MSSRGVSAVSHVPDRSGAGETTIATAEARLVRIPNSMFIEYIPQLEPALRRPVRLDDGFAIPPGGPGHGIEFDPAALARFDATPGTE